MMKRHSFFPSKVFMMFVSLAVCMLFSVGGNVSAQPAPKPEKYDKTWKPGFDLEGDRAKHPYPWERWIKDKTTDGESGGGNGGGTNLCDRAVDPGYPGYVCDGFPNWWPNPTSSYEKRPFCQFNPSKECRTSIVQTYPSVKYDCRCLPKN